MAVRGRQGDNPSPSSLREEADARRLARLEEQRQGMPFDTNDPSFATPPVTLYANRSEESQRAFTLLAEAGVRFSVVPSPRRKHPSADLGCLRFTGLEGIEELVARMKEVENVVIEHVVQAGTVVLDKPDPELKAFMDSLRTQQLEEARSVMAKMHEAAGDKKGGPPKRSP